MSINNATQRNLIRATHSTTLKVWVCGPKGTKKKKKKRGGELWEQTAAKFDILRGTAPSAKYK